MPTQEVLTCLAGSKKARSIQMQIILMCAPVLKNIKISCMFTMPSKYTGYVRFLFEKTELKVYVLCTHADKDVIFVYREKALTGYLKSRRTALFLSWRGYTNGSADSMLALLGERMSDYYDNEGEYPHEAGLFLGYPLEDVTGFMRRGGKNSLLKGYWQVYSDVEQARRTFAAYDRAKEQAVSEFFLGKQICEIAG